MIKSCLFLVTLFITACSPPASDSSVGLGMEDATFSQTHNSRNSLDWAGRYTGIQPCADCEGVETTVILGADGTYEQSLHYLGKSVAPTRQSGRFSWNTAGSIVTLILPDGTEQSYQVGEQLLFYLDRADNPVSGELNTRPVLRQSVHDPRIEDRRWVLVEIEGRPHETREEARQAFLYLQSDAWRVSGNSSCNNFFGTYVVEAGQRIHFADNLAATLMACPDMDAETSFLWLLREIDNYSLSDNQLALNKARMAPVLRFELIPE
jgi:heat shock protein HslJ